MDIMHYPFSNIDASIVIIAISRNISTRSKGICIFHFSGYFFIKKDLAFNILPINRCFFFYILPI